MKFILIFLLYCLIGAIVEFLLVFGVLMYAKRHSKSDEQFVEAWNKAGDLVLTSSLFNTKNINQDIADIFRIHIFTCMLIWPFHISLILLIDICIYLFDSLDHFFYKLTSVLIKR